MRSASLSTTDVDDYGQGFYYYNGRRHGRAKAKMVHIVKITIERQ